MIEIARLTALPTDFGALVTLSLREDFAAMRRMREAWVSGANCFDGPGEAAFEARAAGRLVAVCGINRDPYASETRVGRLRHLYVDPSYRRRGVGRALVRRVLQYAQPSFDRIRLRTQRADADAFYVALGFRRIEEEDATHAL